MPWVSRLLRGERVFVKVGPGGEPAPGADGRVDIVYKPGGKVYRAGVRNLSPDPDPKTLPDSEVAPAGAVAATKGQAPVPADAIIVYTDGACSGNPGPAGLGVVILDGGKRRELSEYLGIGTNNIAELMAIVRALEEVPRDRTIVLHADSSYALGLLGKGWKAKANQEIVERIRKLARDFRDLLLVKVDGHAGVAENERADELARTAIVKRG
ncbi:MAG: ribonuclease [bacterium]|nr:ribonuclease [bacterium]